MRERWAGLFFLVFAMGLTGLAGASEPLASLREQCRFIGIEDITAAAATVWDGDTQIILPARIRAPIAWNQLVVSWNATAPGDSWLELEARGLYPDHATKFYEIALWSDVCPGHPRHSFGPQKDEDGRVDIDTLVLSRPGADVQLRLILGGPTASLLPHIKFVGLAFLDSRLAPPLLAPNRQVWGTVIPAPERSQLAYPQEKGWCSPASVSMVLTRWAAVLGRPELALDVPEVAAGAFDAGLDGTGNWPFNTALAGKFDGMRAYVARLSGLEELEQWVEAGIPVILSAPWHLLAPGRKDTGNGHLIVCIGFTAQGDVVVNDPAANLRKGQSVRRVYKRQDVLRAWKRSSNTVYLVYPQSARIPPDRFGHWEARAQN